MSSTLEEAFPAKPPVVELTTWPSPHPFVRKGLVAKRPENLSGPGLVTMHAPDGGIVGDAIWNPRSDIALRRLTSGDVRFDQRALIDTVDRAVALRESWPGLNESDAWRVVHAEADGLSGLIVDRYGDVLSVQLHSAGWLAMIDPLLEALHGRLGTSFHTVEMADRVARLEGVRPTSWRSDGCPKRLKINEYGVRFHVDLVGGHKTGFFCDQRDNRHDFASLVAGADVADVCCYTGGFSTTAQVLGNPASVTAVDLDESALAVGKANAKLNQVRVSFVHADAFDWLRQLGAGERRFDAIVLDPPKFIASRSDDRLGRGKYHDLNRLAIQLLRPGGLLLSCSCSGLLPRDDLLELVRTAARKAGREARLLRSTGAAIDHPVHVECPESEYLKALWLRVD
ncbi:MAG: 23S rRNA (cytosine1962-C5)-methyltransferase [Pseudohongiellaceae bacterium]|jgi:23S rRNA (cytosine1962-C5)-methyltransferase